MSIESTCGQSLRPNLRLLRLFGLAATLTFVARTADAGQSARLVYSRTNDAVSCGDEHGLRQAVARRLGYDPFVAASMNTVVADLRAEGAGLRAHVYVINNGNTAGASRELSSPSRDCTELLAAVALAISIAVDPDALERVGQAEPTSTTVTSPAEPAPDKVTHASPNSTPRTSPPAPDTTQSVDIAIWPKPAPGSAEHVEPKRLFSVGLGAFGATGPAPLLNYGMWLSLAARFGHWQLQLQPEFTLPSDSDPVGGAWVRVSTYGGNLSAGFTWQHFYLGALFDVVALSGRGKGVTQPNQHTVVHAAAGARLGYHFVLSPRFALIPSIDGLIPFRRVDMQLNHGVAGDGYTSPWASVRLGLNVEYQF